MTRPCLIAGLVVILLNPILRAGDLERLKAELAAWEATRDVEDLGLPLSTLPSKVAAAEGQFTLFADFQDKDEHGVAVYIVNRTKAPVTLDAQDGDVYLKLEYQSPSGEWLRAQPHAFSWCGNSYGNGPTLGVNRYRIVRGYVPAAGTNATVRYALYGQPVKVQSNTGAGIINEDDIRKAANDAMAVHSGSLAFVTKVALGEIELKNEMDHIKDLRNTAIYELGDDRFTDEDATPTLQAIIDKNDETYSVTARTALARREERISEPNKAKQ